MSALKQIGAIVAMNTRAIRLRIAASSVIVVGMASAVAVALSIFSMSAGRSDMTVRTTAPYRMVILGQGGAGGGGGGGGGIPRDALFSILDLPGIKKGTDGKPLVLAEVTGSYVTRKKETGAEISPGFRGTSTNILEVRPEFKIVQGRMFTPGLREVVVGRGAAENFENTALGDKIILPDGPWSIVGVVEDSTGSLANYQLLADVDTLAAAMRRNGFLRVYVNLDESTQEARDRFVAAVKASPGLNVDVTSEYEYFARQMAGGTRFYALLAYGVGGIMGLGVVLAALNTMYSAVAARVTEIATLRAIGFGATPVVISVMVEALALTLIGAVIGSFISWAGFGGREQSFQNVAINLVVTPSMIGAGIGLALVVGFVGAAFPAIRAARLPVATALQIR